MSNILPSLECMGGWVGLWVVLDGCRKPLSHWVLNTNFVQHLGCHYTDIITVAHMAQV